MPQPYGQAVLTNLGEELLAKVAAGHGQIEYVCMVIGNGSYSEEEKRHTALKEQTKLKEEKNRYAFSTVVIENKVVRLTALLTNQDPLTFAGLVPEGYYINEVGIYAKEKDADNSTAILYSMCVTASGTGQGDFMPEYNGHNRSEITQDYILSVDDSIEISVNMIGAVATAADLAQCKGDIGRHIKDFDNPHQTTKDQVGLSEVDNTPDIRKPVSVQQQDAIDAAYQQATGYTDQKIAGLINGAPSTLDTLGEIANAMTNNSSVVEALEISIGKKADVGHIHDDRYYTEAEVNALLNGKAGTGHTHDDRYYTEAETNNLLSSKAGIGHTHDDRYYTKAEVNNLSNGAIRGGILEHWGVITENGQRFTSYVTGCFQFISSNLVNLYFDVLLNEGYGNKSYTQHTHAFDEITLRAALGVSALSWDCRQTRADCILGPTAVTELQDAGLRSALLAMNTMYTDCFSGFRANADGRITRHHHSNGTVNMGGHIYVCGPNTSVKMRQGNIWRIVIIGATYT